MKVFESIFITEKFFGSSLRSDKASSDGAGSTSAQKLLGSVAASPSCLYPLNSQWSQSNQ